MALNLSSAQVQVTYQAIGNGKDFRFVAFGDADPATAQASAIANAKARFALMSVTKLGNGKLSRELTATETADIVPAAAGQTTDAVIVLAKAGQRKHLVTINQMADEFFLAGSDGKVDIANAAVQLFGTNYRDADGNSGYTVADGYEVK